ncbi:hypothetical protein MN032_12710 [Agromyces atrinae]|uniref:hypothetical protein n=1 Tax=Agromyces atrinae TaxID=592376 RepID=UPI001F571E63|nr:hypothetical protein [Agromyces atrinae]MCI2958557.1 hypothetical protein [Agromyces atrinae]
MSARRGLSLLLPLLAIAAFSACATDTAANPQAESVADETRTLPDAFDCRGTSVSRDALEAARPASDAAPAAAAALAQDLAVGPDLADWIIAAETPDSITVVRSANEGDPVALEGDDWFLITVARADQHAIPLVDDWGLMESTSCAFAVPLEGLTAPELGLGDVDRSSTTLPLLALEMDCNSGRDAAGRVKVVEVIETDTTVQLVVGIEPAKDQSAMCPSNPWTPFEVELDAPLGDRTVVDLGTWPAGELQPVDA